MISRHHYRYELTHLKQNPVCVVQQLHLNIDCVDKQLMAIHLALFCRVYLHLIPSWCVYLQSFVLRAIKNYYRAHVQRLLSDCLAIAKRLYSDCIANGKLMHRV